MDVPSGLVRFFPLHPATVPALAMILLSLTGCSTSEQLELGAGRSFPLPRRLAVECETEEGERVVVVLAETEETSDICHPLPDSPRRAHTCSEIAPVFQGGGLCRPGLGIDYGGAGNVSAWLRDVEVDDEGALTTAVGDCVMAQECFDESDHQPRVSFEEVTLTRVGADRVKVTMGIPEVSEVWTDFDAEFCGL